MFKSEKSSYQAIREPDFNSTWNFLDTIQFRMVTIQMEKLLRKKTFSVVFLRKIRKLVKAKLEENGYDICIIPKHSGITKTVQIYKGSL